MSGVHDAVVAGGGLAGCAFALTLARAGRRVALVERTDVARPKVCGDFLSAEAVGLLRQFDMDPVRMGGHRIGTLRIASGDACTDAPLGFGAVGLSRLHLDEAMLAACEAAGVDVLRGHAVGGIEPRNGVAHVRAGEAELLGRSVALATGKHNLRGYPRPGAGPTAYKMTIKPGAGAAQALVGTVQLAMYDGGYIGACLVDGGDMTLCWLADDRLMRESGGRWQRQLDMLASGQKAIDEVLRGAEPAFDRPATVSGMPFGYIRREPIAPNVYPIGDQLAVIPPLAGDGTSIALKSGIDAAAAALRGESAEAFQRRFLGGLRVQFAWASAIQTVFANGLGRRVAARSVGFMPGIATWLSQRTRLAGV